MKKLLLAILAAALLCMGGNAYGAVVTAVAAAGDHTVALKSDGTVWAWGTNRSGEWGHQPTFTASTPVRVSGLTGVVAVGTGPSHSVAAMSNGNVYAWGDNSYGKLGDGTTNTSLNPIQVLGLTEVAAVSAGASNTVALKRDGTVWAWGRGGLCGDGTNTERHTPVQVIGLTGVVAVAAGYDRSVAVKTDGTLWSWGAYTGDGTNTFRTAPVQVVGLSGVVAVASSSSVMSLATFAVKSDGSVWWWDRFQPVPTQVLGITGAVAVAPGESFTVALKGDGSVWGWGGNWYGQLGDGTTISASAPVQVATLSDAVTVAAGDSHAVAVRRDGTVLAWGSDGYCQLGDGTLSKVLLPKQVNGMTDVVAAAGGYLHSMAAKVDGTVWTWGWNNYGQLGIGTTAIPVAPKPVQVPGMADVADVVAGDFHSVALRNDGTIRSWGSNSYGQLGDGTTTDRPSPVTVANLNDVIQVVAAGDNTLALGRDGTVWGWGDNSWGQLGIGVYDDYAPHPTPVQVPDLDGVTQIAAGGWDGGWGTTMYAHCVALKYDGTVWTWGCNGYGQLGDGTYNDRPSPAPVPGLTGVARIAAGWCNTMALKSDGTLWEWGSSMGADLDYTTPTQVTGVANVIAIATSGGWDTDCGFADFVPPTHYSLALTENGNLLGWGDNQDGQLGNGSRETSSAPTAAIGLSDMVAVDAAPIHSLAIRSDGTLWAWGDDSYGAIGDGHSDANPLPIKPLIDTVGPTGPVIANGGDAYTTSRSINLALSATDDSGTVTEMRLSSDGVFDSESWEPYATSKSWTLTEGDGSKTIYVKFRDASLNESETVSCTIVLDSAGPKSVARGKAASTGSVVTFAGKTVTARFADCIYIEDSDRFTGIRVSPAPADADPGDLIDVSGTASVVDGEKTLTLAAWKVQPGSSTILPVGLSNRAVGGGSWLYDSSTGTGQRGMPGLAGLNNTGLLVRTWGKVIEVEPADPPSIPTWFTVDDGSGVNLKCILPPGVTIDPTWRFVQVTGISSCELTGGELHRLLRVRKQEDVAQVQ